MIQRFLKPRKLLKFYSKNQILLPLEATKIEQKADFNAFKMLNPEIQEALNSLKIIKPSEIQNLVIPTILKEKASDVLFCSQTGSGKTLAYATPLIHLTMKEEASYERKLARPRVLVLVPSKELVTQTLKVFKSMSHFAKFSSMGIRSDDPLRKIKNSLKSPVDLIVTTPGIFSHLHEEEYIFLSQLRRIVVDEADVLLGKGFDEEIIQKILLPSKNIENTRHNVQFIFCMASYSDGIKSFIKNEFPNITSITSKHYHKLITNVKHNFIQLKGADKFQLLLETCKKEEGRCIIFCNTIKCAQACDHFLNENGIKVSTFHSEMPAELKEKEFERFMENQSRFLVTTDIASRGIDFKNVKHIIMLDFPETSIDYIHRAGRTGRMFSKGKVTSFLQKKDIELARHIEEYFQSGQKLELISNDRQNNLQVKEERDKLKKKKREVLGKRREYFLKKQAQKFMKVMKEKRYNSSKKTSVSKAESLFKIKKEK